MEVDPHHPVLPKVQVQGVRTRAVPVVRSAFESLLSLAVVAGVTTMLWASSCSGSLGYDVRAHSSTAELLDRSVRALRERPFEELAVTRGEEEDAGGFKLQYSVRRRTLGERRNARDVLEIQAAVLDRRGSTVDRFVTWRARNEAPR